MNLKDKISIIYSRMAILREQLGRYLTMPCKVGQGENNDDCSFVIYISRVGDPSRNIAIVDKELKKNLIKMLQEQHEMNKLELTGIEEKIKVLEKLEKAL